MIDEPAVPTSKETTPSVGDSPFTPLQALVGSSGRQAGFAEAYTGQSMIVSLIEFNAVRGAGESSAADLMRRPIAPQLITNNGQVTLRGPVNSAKEKGLIADIADRIAHTGNVD